MNAIKRAATKSRVRGVLLGLAALRGVLALAAIPLAPVLYDDHFIVLVLLRPTKEVLLAGGFLVRSGDVALLPMLAAAAPLALLGVWLLFFVGRSFADEINQGSGLPRWAEKVIPPKRIRQLADLLDRKGERVIIGGRIAAFPSALLGAAAGASGMEPRSFLSADLIGAVLSVAEVVIAGYALGAAHKEAGPWLTVVGVAVLVGLLVYVGRSLRRT